MSLALQQLRALHISPTHYSNTSVIGGGEKYVIYICRAMKISATSREMNCDVSVLAFGEKPGVYPLGPDMSCEVIHGRPWDPHSININELSAKVNPVDVVFVHQCLTPFGLFVAAHAKLLRKYVVGIDSGGGEHPLAAHTPEIGRIFDIFHAYSKFGGNSFEDIEGRVEVIPGPVDTVYYRPDATRSRDPNLVVAIGRVLPHKGFDRIIRALPRGLRLVICGTGYDKSYLEYLEQLATGAAVEIKQHLTDEEVLVLLQTAGLFVQASTHVDYRGTYYSKPELLGLAPLEALSAGTPTLVSSAGALPELTVIKGCKLFSDDDELRELLSLYSDSSISFPSSDEIHRDVEQKYGLAVFGDKLMNVISAEIESQ